MTEATVSGAGSTPGAPAGASAGAGSGPGAPAGSPQPSNTPSPGAAGPAPPGGRPRERLLLWLLLAGTLVAVVVAGLREKAPVRRASLPVLGQVPNTALLDHQGRTVTFPRDLAGRVAVVDFIFTRCVLTCPRMTAEMLRLEERLAAEKSRVPALADVVLVSVSVDPEHDRPEVLANYARSYQIERPHWWLLTGEPTTVRQLVRDGFKLALEATPPGMPNREAEPITHSSRFVLVDGDGAIRGYVDAFAEGAREQLLADLVALGEEAAAKRGEN
jgi:protein SCO1/2